MIIVINGIGRQQGYQSPGELKVLRNFENAIKKIGGIIIKEYSSEVYMRLEQAGSGG